MLFIHLMHNDQTDEKYADLSCPSLLLPIDLTGQLTFEVVNSPKEYNVIYMVKSHQRNQYRKSRALG